jgi:hypothetical protein
MRCIGPVSVPADDASVAPRYQESRKQARERELAVTEGARLGVSPMSAAGWLHSVSEAEMSSWRRICCALTSPIENSSLK